MSSRLPECPKCGRSMHPGYLLESKHADRQAATEWVAGPPEKSFWTGVTTKNRTVLPVTVYRCERCGYLESYAQPAPPS